MDYAPIVRIILRYGMGGTFAGAGAIGAVLAADPDVIRAGSMLIAGAVEAAYWFAKRNGWAT